MSFSIKLGNLLYKNAFVLYKPLYSVFKKQQDAFEIDLLRRHIKKGDVVLDIGANIGFYAQILSELVSESGKVHCFEPDKINFSHIKNATNRLNNVLLNNKAVGAKTELLKIYTSKNLNVDHRTYKPEEYDKEIDIDAVAIDDYLKNHLKVDFIKIDIQGFEMQAIQGMQQVLQHNNNIKIVSEFWPYGLRTAGSSVMEYFEYLKKLNFNCYLLENNQLKKLDMEQVKALEPLGEKHYFNIFATRDHV